MIMNKEKRRAFIKAIAERESISEEQVITALLLQELDYCHLKCCNPKIDYRKEFDCVMEAYTFEDLPFPEDVIKYKNHILSFGQPWIGHVNHYDLNDTVSYIGEYYDGTPTIKYRKKDRYHIDPIQLQDEAIGVV